MRTKKRHSRFKEQIHPYQCMRLFGHCVFFEGSRRLIWHGPPSYRWRWQISLETSEAESLDEASVPEKEIQWPNRIGVRAKKRL